MNFVHTGKDREDVWSEWMVEQKSVGEQQRGREQGLYWGGLFLLGCSSLSRQELLGDALLDWPIAPTI